MAGMREAIKVREKTTNHHQPRRLNMQIDIVLEGAGGGLARERITVRATSLEATSTDIYNGIHDQDWTLAPGDVVRIVEVT
jgi:hypothetical protein